MLVEKVKLLFIHIPKTGGTTLENYFFHRFKIPPETLYGHAHNGHSLQHCTYLEMKELLLPHQIKTYKILACIRNPFHRIISDLFWFQLIHPGSSPEEVHQAVVHVLTTNQTIGDYQNWDNHFIPQSDYLLDEMGNIPSNMTIIETSDMDSILPCLYPGFKRVPHLNVNPHQHDNNYDKFLSETTKQLIRQYYKKDFDLFFDKEGLLKTRKYYPPDKTISKIQRKRIPAVLFYKKPVVDET